MPPAAPEPTMQTSKVSGMGWKIIQLWKAPMEHRSQTAMQRSRVGLDLYRLALTRDLVIEDDSRLHIPNKGYQISLAENWIWRSPSEPEMTPKVPLPRAVPGPRKYGVFVRLKASARNWSDSGSRSTKFLPIARS